MKKAPFFNIEEDKVSKFIDWDELEKFHVKDNKRKFILLPIEFN